MVGNQREEEDKQHAAGLHTVAAGSRDNPLVGHMQSQQVGLF